MPNNKPTTLTTGEVRISYEHLLKPYANQPGTEEKFSVTLLIPKSDAVTRQRIDAAIQAAAQEGLTSKWGGVRPAQLAAPIYDGDGLRASGEPFGAECKGHWVMTASSKTRPQIVDTNLCPILDSTQIYSGIYARVSINLFPYLNAGKKGVGCGLGPVQKTRDGEPLGNQVSPEDAFGAPPPQYAPPAPGYSQPQYQQQPQYGVPYGAPQQPVQPQYQQQFGAPQQPQAQPPWHTSAQPAYTAYPAQPGQMVDPITGQPLGNVAGGIYGLGQ